MNIFYIIGVVVVIVVVAGFLGLQSLTDIARMKIFGPVGQRRHSLT